MTDPEILDVTGGAAGVAASYAAARRLAEDGLWTWARPALTGDPGTVRVELPVGDATLALGIEEVRAALAALAS